MKHLQLANKTDGRTLASARVTTFAHSATISLTYSLYYSKFSLAAAGLATSLRRRLLLKTSVTLAAAPSRARVRSLSLNKTFFIAIHRSRNVPLAELISYIPYPSVCAVLIRLNKCHFPPSYSLCKGPARDALKNSEYTYFTFFVLLRNQGATKNIIRGLETRHV